MKLGETVHKKILSTAGVFLALLATPSLAQQQSTAMKHAQAVAKKTVDAFNARDAAAVAALDLPNGVSVGPDGNIVKGRAAIQAMYENIFKAWGDFKFTFLAKEAGQTGNGYWAVFDSTVDFKGPNGPVSLHTHDLGVLVPQGKEWKFAVISIGANLPPPGAAPAR